MEFPIEKITTSSNIDIYALHCRVLDTPIAGRIHVIPELEAIVDTGGPSELAQNDLRHAFENLRTDFGVNFRLEDVRHVFLTHGHVDHVGGLPLFNFPHVTSYIHELDLAMVSHTEMFTQQSKVSLERFFESCRIPLSHRSELRKIFSQCWIPTQDYSIGRLLRDNDKIGPFTFYHVPGHTRGQMNIQLDNVLFSGDNIMSQTVTPPLWPHSFSRYLGCASYQRGFTRMKEVIQSEGIEILLPSHEETIYEPLKRLSIIEKAEKRRYKRILDFLQIGDSSMSFEQRCQCVDDSIMSSAWEIVNRYYVTPTLHLLIINLFDAASRLEYLRECASALQAA